MKNSEIDGESRRRPASNENPDIATYFNLHQAKFVESHYLFEFNRRQTIFFEIKCLELYELCHTTYVVVSFFGVQFKSKHLREKNEKKLSFCKNLWLKILILRILNGQSPNGLKLVIITFYLPHIFQYIRLKNVANYFCFWKKQAFAFY